MNEEVRVKIRPVGPDLPVTPGQSSYQNSSGGKGLLLVLESAAVGTPGFPETCDQTDGICSWRVLTPVICGFGSWRTLILMFAVSLEELLTSLRRFLSLALLALVPVFVYTRCHSWSLHSPSQMFCSCFPFDFPFQRLKTLMPENVLLFPFIIRRKLKCETGADWWCVFHASVPSHTTEPRWVGFWEPGSILNVSPSFLSDSRLSAVQ